MNLKNCRREFMKVAICLFLLIMFSACGGVGLWLLIMKDETEYTQTDIRLALMSLPCLMCAVIMFLLVLEVMR